MYSKSNLMKELAKKKETSENPAAILGDDSIPKPKQIPEVADVFMNIKKDPHPIRGALETSEDDTLMGRLAKRMASRDYIDKLDLGLGTKANRSAAAATADMNDVPRKMNIEGPAKIEEEHSNTLKKVESGKVSAKEAPKEIAKDHIKEMGPGYYPALKNMESSLMQEEKGFGLHQQTSDKKAFNPSDPISSTNNKVIKGKNMAEQAKNVGNIYNS